jgi:hypothetical protein
VIDEWVAYARQHLVRADEVIEEDGSSNVRIACAPCEGGVFQWVQAPPGNRFSRKQPEQSWR